MNPYTAHPVELVVVAAPSHALTSHFLLQAKGVFESLGVPPQVCKQCGSVLLRGWFINLLPHPWNPRNFNTEISGDANTFNGIALSAAL